jgi:hypothetical protein
MTYLRDGCVGKCNSQSFLSDCGVSPYVHAVQYMCNFVYASSNGCVGHERTN